jgi:hypothetical protein
MTKYTPWLFSDYNVKYELKSVLVGTKYALKVTEHHNNLAQRYIWISVRILQHQFGFNKKYADNKYKSFTRNLQYKTMVETAYTKFEKSLKQAIVQDATLNIHTPAASCTACCLFEFESAIILLQQL